jgi:membrane-associated protein
VFELLSELVSGSPWTYGAVGGVAAFDAVLPILPSEAMVISAGVLAASGRLSIPLVIAAGAAGALVGDNGAYSVGRALRRRVEARIARSSRAARHRAWAERKLERGAAGVLLASRFVPGGRTAATITAGLLPMRWSRFLLFSSLAALTWASGTGLLGYLGGRAFEQKPYLIAIPALALGALYLGARWARSPMRWLLRLRRLPA